MKTMLVSGCGFVTINDLYEAANMPSKSISGNTYGWFNIDEWTITKGTDDDYILHMTRPSRL